MRGSNLHNHILLDGIEHQFRLLGGLTRREQPTRSGRSAGFIDLFIRLGKHRIACEAELTADRVLNDLHKATEIGATHLLIVCPRTSVARSVQSRLDREGFAGTLDCWVLPLGKMLCRIQNQFTPYPTTQTESGG